MEIDFTKKEYRLLLDMLAIADWIMHANAIEEEHYFHEHQKLKDKLLSYYKQMDATDIIKSAQDLNGFFETNDYEQYIQNSFIQPYDEQYFWDELIDRLSQRDAVSTVGFEEYVKMECEERLQNLDEIKERYANEFQESGLNNLKINHSEPKS